MHSFLYWLKTKVFKQELEKTLTWMDVRHLRCLRVDAGAQCYKAHGHMTSHCYEDVYED